MRPEGLTMHGLEFRAKPRPQTQHSLAAKLSSSVSWTSGKLACDMKLLSFGVGTGVEGILEKCSQQILQPTVLASSSFSYGF